MPFTPISNLIIPMHKVLLLLPSVRLLKLILFNPCLPKKNQNKKKGKGKNKEEKNNNPQYDKAKMQTAMRKTNVSLITLA